MQLNANQVLQLENDWFEEQILSQTSGRGANVIFCTLAGNSFHASLRCLAVSGRIMQLNKGDIELGHKIGILILSFLVFMYKIIFIIIQQKPG